jgi:hypothetical protein
MIFSVDGDLNIVFTTPEPYSLVAVESEKPPHGTGGRREDSLTDPCDAHSISAKGHLLQIDDVRPLSV